MKPVPGPCVILTDPAAGYEAAARVAVSRGAAYLQLRMKGRLREEVLRTAVMLRRLTLGTETLFIVNDDVSVAAECGADGVHLGQDDMPLAEARQLWDVPGKLFGQSTHSPEQVMRAVAAGADYIGIGPVFPTPTKVVPDPVLGIDGMSEMLSLSTVPAVVLGGINAGNLAEVLAAGAVSFAAVRPLMETDDPGAVLDRLFAIWRAC